MRSGIGIGIGIGIGDMGVCLGGVGLELVCYFLSVEGVGLRVGLRFDILL